MNNLIRLTLTIGIATFCLWHTPAPAHEFWLDPQTNTAELGQVVSADMRVGQDFLGQELPYLTDTVQAMTHWAPSGSKQLDARLGDLPAMQKIPLDQPGLHRVSLETNLAYIVFDSFGEFSDYLAYEGLEDAGKLHTRRGLPNTDIAEGYIRNARTLIQVGPADESQSDSSTGMPFEIVALGNPFMVGLTSLNIILTWQNMPVAHSQIAVFHIPEGGRAGNDTTRSLLVTDDYGKASAAVQTPGSYMLNAVRIDPVDGPGSVVWESYWASLTFKVTAP